MNPRVMIAVSVIIAFLLVIIGLLVALVADAQHHVRMDCDTSSTPWRCIST